MKHLRLPSFARIAKTAMAMVAGLIVLPPKSAAQFVYNQDFKGTSASGWVFGSAAGSPFTPVLTAATGLDPVGNGWLRMTDLQGYEATYARLTTPIPSANNNVTVALDLAMWNKGAGGAADGITISLRDASVPFAPGAYGGSLGYANRSDAGGVAGMAGGYFSLGIDNYGNYSNPTEGRNGGPGFVPNAIATRGPGSGQTGYAYLGGTGDLSTAPYNLGQLDFPNNTTRPDQSGTDYRQIVFNLDSSSILTVSLKLGTSGTLTQIYTADLSGYARPENLELVYTGSTGGAQQINEIRSLVVTTTAAPVGNVYYSNYANDNKWGTGANWGDSNTPNLGLVPGNSANLIFSNNPFTTPAFQLTTAQNVDLQQNRQAASIQFDAPFNYTLQGYQLTLDNGANSTAITVTSAQPGGAHTIQSNLVLNSNLNINTNTATALVLSGAVAAGTKTITLNNLGTTTFSGSLSGSGAMTQIAAGTTVISGNATGFTGAIDIQKGMLQLGASNVLNAGTALSLSSATGTGTFNLAGNNQTLGALTFTSGGVVTTGSGGMLTLGGNVTSSASATQAQILGNLNLGSANRTFNIAQGAADPDLQVAANISGNAGVGLVKSGAGAMVLAGNNSYSGATSVTAGTLIAAHDNALGTAGAATTTTVSSGATLGLQGGINVSALENLSINGTGDAGNTANLGVITNLSGNNAIGGAVTLAGNSRIGAASGTTLTLNGPVGESGGARTFTANGTGTIVLGASNTYSGATTVNNGATLVAAANGALGNAGTGAAGTTTVASGGTLAFQGGITYANPVTGQATETLNVTGTGATGRNGAIDNLSGANTFAGDITLSGNTRIGAAAGSTLTLTGAIGESGAGRTLTIGGAGTVVLGGSAANTYTGATTVNSGATLIAAKDSAMGTVAQGTTVASGATLGFQGNTSYSALEGLSVSGTGAAGRNGAIENLAGNNSYSGAVTMTGATTVATAAGSTLTINGAVSGAFALTKSGTGTFVLTGANTYSGATSVTGGTLALSGAAGALATSGITVSNATLKLDNATSNNGARIGDTTPITLNDGALTFVGNTAAASTETVGALTLGSGNNTLNVATGTASLTAALTLGDIIRTGSSTLTINSYSNAAMTTRSTLGQGVAGSPGVFLTTDAFNNTSGLSLAGATTAAPIALPGWITTTTASGSTEFVEYSGDSGTGNGIRPISTVIGSSGINLNNPTKVVELNASSPQSAWKLDNPGPTSAPYTGGGIPVADRSGGTNGKVTVDGGLKLVDVPTVDLNTDASFTLVLKNGGLLKNGATTTNFVGAGALTSGNNYLAVTVDNAGGTLAITAPIVDNATSRGVTGALSLTKAGPGLLTLGGANTYTGGNFLTDGTVRITAENNLGAATNDVTFSGGTLNVGGTFTASTGKVFSVTAGQTGTLDIDSGATLTLGNLANVLTTADVTGSVIKNGAGSLVIQNANASFDGTLVLNAGTVQVNNAQSLGDAVNRGSVTLAGGTLDLRGDAAASFSNNVTVTGNAAINVDRLTTGTNLTHTLGTLTMGANTLTVTGGNAFDLAFGATTLNGAATINTATSGSDVTLGAVSGAGSLTKDGAATLLLSGANSYAGATTITGGTLRIGSAAAVLPSTTNLTIASGATFDLNGFAQSVASIAGGGNVTMSAGLTTGSGNSNTAFSGVISGSGGLTKTGTGTLTLSGANTFTGALALNQGTIAYAGANVLADSVAVTLAAPGTLNLAGNSDTIGSLAGAGAVQLGGGTLTTGGDNTSTSFSGVISGSAGGGSLVKAGTGTMTLSGANTYGGTTSVTAGTLAISNSAALGTGDGTAATGTTIGANATLQLSGAINIANEALALSGSGASGNGALQNVSGNNALGGPITLASAAAIAVNSGNLSLNNTVTNGGNTLSVGGQGNTIANGAITGAGGLTKSGAGALILNSTANSYAGATAINAGSIQIGADNAGPASSAVTIASGATLDVNNKAAAIASLAGAAGSSVVLGTGTLTAGGDNSSTTFAGVVSGASGGLTKTGTGTLTLSGANTFTGATAVNAGTLQAGANNVLTNQTAVTVAGGATFNVNGTTQAVGSIAGSGAITLGAGQLVAGASNASTTYSGAMSGTGTFTKDGTGNLVLAGANTYTGQTTIANGTLTLGASNVIADAGRIAVNNGATLATSSGVTEQIAGLTTNASSTLSLAANSTLTINSATGTTLLGAVTGTGTLAFTGGGDLTLGGNLNFGGTLTFGGATIGSTPTATLFLGSSQTIGTLKITGDTILDFGSSTASVLTTTNFEITPGVKIAINNWAEWQDYFYVNGTWTGATIGTRGQGAETQVTFNGHQSWETNWQSWDRQITPTPEPATYGLMMTGALAGLLGWRRWRKQRTA